MSIGLSLCIATLNRGDYLGATLDSIVTQATDEVEIVIVDGASTDDTEAVVRRYMQTFDRLRYLRLDVKGGVDRDYCRAVELARGEYCWLMTDDDLLKPGALAAVLAAIRRPYALVVVNAEVHSADMARLLVPRRLDFDGDRVYRATDADRQRLLAEVGDYLSFIGGVVIQRQLWASREKEPYFGSEFVHVGVIFQAPLPGDTLVLAEPLIMIRYGNAQWTTRYFQVWMFQWPGLIWSLPRLPDAVKRRVSHPEPWRRAWALLLFRARGAYGLDDYHAWIAPRAGSAPGKLAARLIAQLPGCVLNLLASLYARARRYHPLLVDLGRSRFSYRQCWTRWRALGSAPTGKHAN